MINKEILEIKKQFTPENCAITRMCGCYVDHEKTRKYEVNRSFLSLPEEEAFKYFDLFKQTLTGTLGKKLINMEFPLSQEEPEGTQEFLLRLRDSKLQDESLIDEFYNKIIESYDFGENYYIILIHSVYDVPAKATDGIEMFDASDSIYEYVLCSICPVTLAKPGLSYDAEQNSIIGRNRDWVVQAPATGFLFPAFNDRNTDIHQVLYFSKKPEELQPKLIETFFGTDVPLSAESQKVTFNAIISETLEEECDYTMVRSIHENLQEMIEESKEEPEPLQLDKHDVKRLLEDSGVSESKMERFDTSFEHTAGDDTAFLAANIAETKKFNIQTPDITIKVNPDCAGLVETRVIDDRRCLVIAINDQIEVNGLDIDVSGENNG